MNEKKKELDNCTEKHQQAIILNPDQINLHSPEDEIDLREVWQVIWKGKWIIILTTVIFGIAGALYSRTLPDIYQSSASLTSSSNRDFLSSAINYGGLTSVNNSSFQYNLQNTKTAVETLNSRVFLKEFINKYNLKPELLAVKSWNPEKNKLVFDNNAYNNEEKSWIRHGELQNEAEPADQLAISKFQRGLNIHLNPKNYIVTLSVKHYSPFIAQKWIQWLVGEFNLYMQKKDMEDANKRIGSLNQQLQKITLPETKKAIKELISNQRNKLILIEVADEYVFETIDPAFLPATPVEPKRQLILMVSLLLGFSISVLCLFLFNFFKKEEV